ncbi:unnamed protein product [Meloidogyne enterolobii]|uniref:Uncharacterized protein n=1 Tax=Meloidogyne enterolobii TaxID=390850 RepID=A0ACB0YZY0_MELEN
MSLSSPIIKTQIPASSDTKTTTNNNINSQKQQNLVKNKNSNGGNFHSISLRSPANQPVVLSFEGNYYNNNDTNGDVATKLRVEENRKNSEERKSKDVIYIPQTKINEMPRSWISNFCQRPLASRRFLLCLVALLSLLAILLIISLVFVLLSVRWPNGEENDDVDFLNKHSSWQYSCDHKCNANFSVPPLLIISMDGFRADYLKRGITHSVSRILECGSSAQYMLPSFPSKTFPNHFTIVTGLYPESHGIVDNHFYDEYMPNEVKNFAKSSRNPAWYNGEPIWNTVAKNGKKSAVFFWPGSEVAIQGILPTYRFAYDSSKPFFTRARQPDTAMHREGPDSDAVNSALIYVDAMINYLMHQLDDNGLLGCINIVILSDHGR